jgi:pheromone shutdown-related protein TraB
MASFQKRVAKNLGIKPGQEMIQAIETAEATHAKIHLADRDIRVTLARIWHAMRWWDKIKLLFQIILSLGNVEEISEKDIEKMKQQDMIESFLSEMGKEMPILREILIDERDRYLCHRIQTAPGNKIVAVVGAGHIPGIKSHFNNETDITDLEALPPKKTFSRLFKWIIPLFIMGLFIAGFFYGGSVTGSDMILRWILANGILAGLGALIALAHPFTIVSSVLAAPLTSINPLIAAGWVSGLVEALVRKPRVKDFEALSDDILTVKGFWKNKVTRILLVVVFTNLGSTVGTVVALPLMIRLL